MRSAIKLTHLLNLDPRKKILFLDFKETENWFLSQKMRVFGNGCIDSAVTCKQKIYKSAV